MHASLLRAALEETACSLQWQPFASLRGAEGRYTVNTTSGFIPDGSESGHRQHRQLGDRGEWELELIRKGTEFVEKYARHDFLPEDPLAGPQVQNFENNPEFVKATRTLPRVYSGNKSDILLRKAEAKAYLSLKKHEKCCSKLKTGS